MAWFRAVETAERSERRLFEDPYAMDLLRSGAHAAHRRPGGEAIRAGARQLRLLGAGFDSRMFPRWLFGKA